MEKRGDFLYPQKGGPAKDLLRRDRSPRRSKPEDILPQDRDRYDENPDGPIARFASTTKINERTDPRVLPKRDDVRDRERLSRPIFVADAVKRGELVGEIIPVESPPPRHIPGGRGHSRTTTPIPVPYSPTRPFEFQPSSPHFLDARALLPPPSPGPQNMRKRSQSELRPGENPAYPASSTQIDARKLLPPPSPGPQNMHRRSQSELRPGEIPTSAPLETSRKLEAATPKDLQEMSTPDLLSSFRSKVTELSPYTDELAKRQERGEVISKATQRGTDRVTRIIHDIKLLAAENDGKDVKDVKKEDVDKEDGGAKIAAADDNGNKKE